MVYAMSSASFAQTCSRSHSSSNYRRSGSGLDPLQQDRSSPWTSWNACLAHQALTCLQEKLYLKNARHAHQSPLTRNANVHQDTQEHHQTANNAHQTQQHQNAYAQKDLLEHHQTVNAHQDTQAHHQTAYRVHLAQPRQNANHARHHFKDSGQTADARREHTACHQTA